MHKYRQSIILGCHGGNPYGFIQPKLRKVQNVFYCFQGVSQCQDTGLQSYSRGRKIHCSSKHHSLGRNQCSSNHGNCNYDRHGISSIPADPLVCFPFLKQLFPSLKFLHFLQRKLITFNIICWNIPFQLWLSWTFLCRHLLHHSFRPTEVSSVPSLWQLPQRRPQLGCTGSCHAFFFFSGWVWILKF